MRARTPSTYRPGSSALRRAHLIAASASCLLAACAGRAAGGATEPAPPTNEATANRPSSPPLAAQHPVARPDARTLYPEHAPPRAQLRAGAALASPLDARAVWSVSGALWALAAERDRVFVLETARASTRHELRCGARIEDIVFSPDERFLAVSGDRVCVYSLTDCRVIFEQAEPRYHGVGQLAWSPQGDLLALAGGAHLTLFDVRDDGIREDPARHAISTLMDGLHRVAFHPEGRLVATGGALSRQGGATPTRSEPIRVWNAVNGKPWATLLGHQRPIAALQYAHDGSYLASLDEGGVVMIWPRGEAPGRVFPIASAAHSAGGALGLSLASDGQRLAVSANDGMTALFAPTGDQALTRLRLRLGRAEIVQVILHPTRPLLAAIDRAGELGVYDLRSSVRVARASVPGAVRGGLRFLPAPERLAIARSDGVVQLLAL